MLKNLGQMVLMAAAVFAAEASFSDGLSGPVLSNAELLRSSGNVTGIGFCTSSATFGLSSGSVGVLDWSTLNVGAGESLKFGNGVWYNAVTGSDASQIAGSILGSGANVYLFNPSGVFFTKGSSIDVGTFTAAGFAMSNLDDLIADPTLAPSFTANMTGDIDAMHAKFGSGHVNLYGRSVFVEESTFAGALSIAAGEKVAVDNVGGGIVSFKVSGKSGDASFVDSSAGELEIKAMGNARLESSDDLSLGNVSAGKNVSAVADGAVSVVGRVAAKQNVYVSAGQDVTWAGDGILRAGGNVHVESTAGNVVLGSISAAKASVSAAGDISGRLGASGDVLEKGEKVCATYRLDADGTVMVSFESATVDVRGRGGVTLEAEKSLTIAPVAVSTVVLDPGSDKQGKPALLETKVDDEEIGGYQSPASDVRLFAPNNLTVGGKIQTLVGGVPERPGSVSLETEKGDVAVMGEVSAEREILVKAGRDITVAGSVAAGGTAALTAEGAVSIGGLTKAGDIRIYAEGGDVSIRGLVLAEKSADIAAAGDIRIDGSAVSEGSLDLTADGAVALGVNPNSLVSDDISITVDAAGDSTCYEGGAEDGVLVLTRTKKGTAGRLTSAGAVLLVDGSTAGGAPEKVAAMQGLEAMAAIGNSALPVRDPHAALSASRFDPADVSAQLPGGTNKVVRDETALVRATKEEEPWMLKNVRK